ncbi:hypothetical protein, partial [Escherichia coli]|uniref:hypothetical protein n=2 Tax=Escherichia coli TaxID=562 RepID=UPI000BB88BC7
IPYNGCLYSINERKSSGLFMVANIVNPVIKKPNVVVVNPNTKGVHCLIDEINSGDEDRQKALIDNNITNNNVK